MVTQPTVVVLVSVEKEAFGRSDARSGHLPIVTTLGKLPSLVTRISADVKRLAWCPGNPPPLSNRPPAPPLCLR